MFSLRGAGGVRAGDSVFVGRRIARCFSAGCARRGPSRRPAEHGASAIAGQPIVWPTAAKMTILVVVVVAMFFTWRPWCTLFCPLGAIYGLLNHVSFLFLRFHPNRCIDCADCRSLCLDGGQAERRLDGLRCVRCLECTQCRAVTVETVLTAHPYKPHGIDVPPPKPKLTLREGSVVRCEAGLSILSYTVAANWTTRSASERVIAVLAALRECDIRD